MLGFTRLAALARTSTHCNAVALCRLVCMLPVADQGGSSTPSGPDLSHPPRLARIIALTLRAASEDAEVLVRFSTTAALLAPLADLRSFERLQYERP